MFVVAIGYDSVEHTRLKYAVDAESYAGQLSSGGQQLVSIWDDADFDSRLARAEPLSQFELPRPRSAKLAREPRVFGRSKTPVAQGDSRAASLSDRGRRGSR